MAQSVRREVIEMVFKVEMKPIITGEGGLQAGEVWHLQIKEAVGLEQARNQGQRRLGMIQMFQNMPKDHRIEMLLSEITVFQRLGIHLKARGLCCSPGCQ